MYSRGSTMANCSCPWNISTIDPSKWLDRHSDTGYDGPQSDCGDGKPSTEEPQDLH